MSSFGLAPWRGWPFRLRECVWLKICILVGMRSHNFFRLCHFRGGFSLVSAFSFGCVVGMHSKWGWCAGCVCYISSRFCTLHSETIVFDICTSKHSRIERIDIDDYCTLDVYRRRLCYVPVNVNNRGVNLPIYENQCPLLRWNVAVNLTALFPFPGGGGWYTSSYTHSKVSF